MQRGAKKNAERWREVKKEVGREIKEIIEKGTK